MIFKKWITRIHLWAGLILGVQVLLWMVSGLIMSWFHINDVRGSNFANEYAQPVFAFDQMQMPIKDILAQHRDHHHENKSEAGILTLELKNHFDEAAYDITFDDGSRIFVSAIDGRLLSPLMEDDIIALAKRDFAGAYETMRVNLLQETPNEYRRETPIWQVQFDDKHATRLYISPVTGEIRSRRNRLWRIFDFMWMLHIMDYDEREDVNNPLLRIASVSGTIFAITGLGLVFIRLRSKRYGNDLRKATGRKLK